MVDHDEIVLRLEKAERHNGRMRLALICSMILSIAAVSLALTSHFLAKHTVQTQELVLKNQSGQVVARLGSRSSAACLEILGQTKDASAMLCAGDETGAGLVLTTHHGDSRALISAGGKMYETIDNSVPPSILIAQAGKGLVSLTVGTDRSLGVAQKDGGNSGAVSVLGQRPTVSLFDEHGKVLWSAR
jgi:hypothetical protein